MQECLRRAKAAGIGWPLAAEFDEALLQGDSIGAKFPFKRVEIEAAIGG